MEFTKLVECMGMLVYTGTGEVYFRLHTVKSPSASWLLRTGNDFQGVSLDKARLLEITLDNAIDRLQS